MSETQGDPELQKFVMMQQQQAQLQSEISKITHICWDKCMDKPRDKLDYKTETCMTNCVERFLDVSNVIGKRTQQLIQRQMQNN